MLFPHIFGKEPPKNTVSRMKDLVDCSTFYILNCTVVKQMIVFGSILNLYVTVTFHFSIECFEEHIRYVGPSILNESCISAPNALACNRLCFERNRESIDCAYFAFNPQNNQCFLMGPSAIGDRRAVAYWV